MWRKDLKWSNQSAAEYSNLTLHHRRIRWLTLIFIHTSSFFCCHFLDNTSMMMIQGFIARCSNLIGVILFLLNVANNFILAWKKFRLLGSFELDPHLTFPRRNQYFQTMWINFYIDNCLFHPWWASKKSTIFLLSICDSKPCFEPHNNRCSDNNYW